MQTKLSETSTTAIKVLIKTSAFTLAEVLITLAVIGIVAALTIPALVQKYQDRAAVSHLRKVYSVLTQAWELATLEYGPVSEWNLWEGTQQEDMIIERMSKYIKFNKICKLADKKVCFPNITYLSSVGTPYNNWTEHQNRAMAELPDGTLLMVNVLNDGSDPHYLQFYIDLNGKRKPNKLGDDFFYFYVFPDNKLRPGGWDSDRTIVHNDFENACLNAYGYTCANWVIEKGNRDYLRCKDLSYDGKSKCD